MMSYFLWFLQTSFGLVMTKQPTMPGMHIAQQLIMVKIPIHLSIHQHCVA